MKLAVSTYSLWQWRSANKKSLENTIAWIAEESGAEAVEFAGLDEKAQANPRRRAAALRRSCEKAKLAIAGYCVGAELLVDDAAQKQAIEQVKREVDVAAELGVKTMRHDVTRGFPEGWKGPKTFAAALKVVVPAIREIAEYAQGLGVMTTLENHGFYMQASERVEKLLLAVKHPNFALTLDMGNFLCVNDDPVQAVARLAKYAVMCHAKDFHIKPKNRLPASGWFATPTPIGLRGAIVGHGDVDVPQQLALLKKAGYKGFLSLEFEGMEESSMAVKAGIEYLRRQLGQ